MKHDSQVLVRAAEPSDYEAVRWILAEPRALHGTLQLPFTSAEVWRKRMTETMPGFHFLVAEVTGKVVGQLGLSTFPNRPRRWHVGQLGMAVADDYQGKGVGTAMMQAAVDLADRWLNLRRLELEVYVDNEPAIALYRKFGFEIEGTLREYAYRDGKFVDAFVMSRIRPREQD